MTDKPFDRKKSYGLAVLSGILLLLSFPPFNLGSFLAWIAFVPLLIAVWNEKNLKMIGRLTLITGLFLTPVWTWLYYELSFWFPPFSSWLGLLIAFAMGKGLYTEMIEKYWKPKHLPSKGLQYLPQRLQIVILPILFTASWFLLLNIPGIMKITGGLGFGSLAKTQWLNPPILQLASFTGMYGITFLILIVNCAIAYAIICYKENKRLCKQSIFVLLVFGLIFSLGFASIPEFSTGNVNSVIIQAPPEEGDIEDLYVDLSREATKYDPKVILWTGWMLEGPSIDLEQFSNLSTETNTYMMGVGGEEMGWIVASPDGKIGHSSWAYHYVNFVNEVIHSEWDKLLYPKIQVLDTEFGRVGPLICMESSSTIPARQLAKDGAQFFTIFTGTIGFSFPGEIGGNAVYRAVEHRKPVILACPEGSIVVDSYGRIVNDISTQDIVAGKFSISNETTFYSKYGNVFGWSIVGLAIVLVGYNFYLKRKSPFKYCQNCSAKLPKDAKFCSQCGKNPDKKEKGKAGKVHKYGEMAFVIITIIIILLLAGVL